MAARGRGWSRWIAIGAGLGAFVAVVGIAVAGLHTESKRVQISAQADGSATAACPSGSEAVSGGFGAPGFDPTANGPANLPFTSSRKRDGKWQAQAHNFGMQKGAFVTYAYCDKHEPGLSVKSKADMIQSFSNGSVTARCPSGSEAVSGGFHSPKGGPTGQTLFAYASKRVGDRKWRVSVVSNDGMNANKLTVFAYCDKRQPGLVSRSKQTTVTAGDSVSLTVRCKNGGEPFSGGYESTLDTTTGVDTAFAFTSRRTSSSTWKVSAFGNAGGTTPTVTAFAYCKR